MNVSRRVSSIVRVGVMGIAVVSMADVADARRETATTPQEPAPPAATAQPSKEQVERLTLSPGPSSAAPVVRKGTVVGSASHAFQFSGRKGQVVSVDLRSTSTSLYFNLRPAQSLEAVYASDRGETGNKADIVLPADGEYRIDVYLFRSAARRGAKAPYTISIALKP